MRSELILLPCIAPDVKSLPRENQGKVRKDLAQKSFRNTGGLERGTRWGDSGSESRNE